MLRWLQGDGWSLVATRGSHRVKQGNRRVLMSSQVEVLKDEAMKLSPEERAHFALG